MYTFPVRSNVQAVVLTKRSTEASWDFIQKKWVLGANRPFSQSEPKFNLRGDPLSSIWEVSLDLDGVVNSYDYILSYHKLNEDGSLGPMVGDEWIQFPVVDGAYVDPVACVEDKHCHEDKHCR